MKETTEPYYKFFEAFMTRFDENGLAAPDEIALKRAYSTLDKLITKRPLSKYEKSWIDGEEY